MGETFDKIKKAASGIVHPFRDTGWSYETSSGVGATIGELAEVTIQHCRLYVKSEGGAKFKIIAQGVGGGVGASLLPASINVSTADMPSFGTSIKGFYRNTLRLADLSKFFAIYSASGVWGPGWSGSVVIFFERLPIKIIGESLFTSPDEDSSIADKIIEAFPTPFPLVSLKNPKITAVFLMTGLSISTAMLGAEATGVFYAVASTEPIIEKK